MSYDFNAAPPLVPGSTAAQLAYRIWSQPDQHFLVPSESDVPHLPTALTLLRIRANCVLDMVINTDPAYFIKDTFIRLIGERLMMADIADAIVGHEFLVQARSAKFVIEAASSGDTSRLIIETALGQMPHRRVNVVAGGARAPITISHEMFPRDIPLDLILAGAAP